MKKIIIYIFVGLFIGLIFLVFHGNEQNGFYRTIIAKSINILGNKNLPSSKFYFVGSSGKFIFLKNLYTPGYLYYIDTNLKDLKRIDLKLNVNSIVYNQRLNVAVQNSSIFILNNTPPSLTVKMLNNKTQLIASLPSAVFDQPTFLSSGSIISRMTEEKKEQINRFIAKFDYRKKVIVKKFTLEKQVDGFFCNDGLLKYDAVNSLLFYMYYYRGEVLCLDTNLNLVYKLKTIDTIKHAKIKIAKIVTKNKEDTTTTLTQATPPKYVNKRFFIDKNYVYIQSALKAENEKQSDFRANQIVDMYDKKRAKYIRSFYILGYKGKRPKQIINIGSSLYSIYDNRIVRMEYWNIN